jgi:hypothetical protein
VNDTVGAPVATFHQPDPAAVGVKAAAIAGTLTSRVIVTDELDVPPALVAEQVSVTPAVSELTVVEPQSVVEVTADSGSLTVQDTVTSLVYQPFRPSVPTTVGVITGAVVSTGVKETRLNVRAPD